MLLLMCLLSGSAHAQTKPHAWPAFRYQTDTGKNNACMYNVPPEKGIRAVSVCAVWKLTDTAERTLWSVKDSSGKVAAKAGGRAVRTGVPAVRTDIASLGRKARKRPLTFAMGGDSVRMDALLETLFYPYALTRGQRVAAETYLALKYGVTLHEDYLSPKGDTLWFYDTDKQYSHAIAGIGRDTLHGMHRVEGISAESGLLKLRLLPDGGKAELLPGEYLLWGASEGKLSFGCGSAFATVADSIVLFDLMERAWLVRATNITNCRTQISVAADSLPGTDSLYLLLDRSGKGYFDGADCYGPAKADSGGRLVFEVRWDSDNSGTDMFTFARAGIPERVMSSMPPAGETEDEGSESSTGIRDARIQSGKTAVWPNPASERLHVQTGMTAPVEAIITDSQGRLLLRQSFAQPSFEINVSSLSPGSHTLQLRSNEGSQSIPFVVKRKQ